MSQARSLKIVFGLFIIGVLLGIYLPGLRNELVFDDLRFKDTIFGNYGGLLELKQRMLSYSSFVWLEKLLGDGWWKQRIFNLILHGGVVVALYALMRDLLSITKFPEDFEATDYFLDSRQAALIVGIAVFAVNPMAVYAVGYLVQRSIVMATLFSILAWWFFVRGLLTNRLHWHALALFAYFCAVLSKEYAVLAAAMAVPLYVYIKRPGWKIIVATMIASLIFLGIVSAVILHSYGNIFGKIFDEQSINYAQQLETLNPGITQKIYSLSILNEAALFFKYGFLWFFPNVLWMSIDLRPAFPTSLFDPLHLFGAVSFFLLSSLVVYIFFKKRNFLGFIALCLLFPVVLYFTEFFTVWVQDPFVLYRSYFWAIAVPGLIAVCLTGINPKIIYALGFVLTSIYGGLALERNLTFHDEFTLWSDAAEKIDIDAPPNAIGRWRSFLNLGAYYTGKGMYQQALDNFSIAHKLGAQNGVADFNMGVILQKLRKPKEALAALNEAEAQGFQGKASINFQKGEALLATGNMSEALQSYTRALETTDGNGPISSEFEKFRNSIRQKRGRLAMITHQYDIAIEDYQALIKSTPNAQNYQYGLGLAYVGKNKPADAIAIFDKLIGTSPMPPFYYGRSMAYLKMGNKPAGFKDLDKAIELDPKNLNYQRIRIQIAAGMPIN